MIKKTVLISPALAAALAVLTVSAAQADLKVVELTRIDNPQLKAYMETMTPQQRAQMSHSGNPLLSGGAQQATVYVHGSKSRADVGSLTYITDSVTKKTTRIDRSSHTYAIHPYRVTANQISATVKDTGQTKRISGHPARRYTLTATLPSQPGTVIQGEIWAAQDVPQPALLTSGQGPFAAVQDLLHKVKGLPLKTTLAVTGSPMGSTTFQTSVVSLSKAPLPPSVFAVPAGYKKTDTGG